MFTRCVLGLLTMLLLSACASVPDKKVPEHSQVQPVSEVVLLQCGKFEGAVVTVTGGEIVSIDDAKAARAVYDALPEKARGVVETGTDEDCAPKQST